jgi:hypothetical protein
MEYKTSLTQRIKNYFKGRPTHWINGGEIEALSIQAGYKGSTASRRMRDLASKGILDRKLEMGSVWYKFNQ